MARYWRQNIQGLSEPSTPPVDPLTGLQPMRRDRWEAPMRAQDHVPTVGRRVILEEGCSAATDWRYPAANDSQVLYSRTRARLTSGSMLRAQVTYVPSGAYAGVPEEDNFPATDAFGQLDLAITWTAEDSTTETETVVFDLEPSNADGFDAPSEPGAAFAAMRTIKRVITPPVDLTDAAEANRWTVSPTVEIAAYTRGSVRIVDLVISEVPYQVVFESDDDSWTSHVFGVSDVDAETNAASNRPRTRRSETSPDGNPRGGTLQTIAVAREQRKRFGPMLVHWTNYLEASAGLSTGLEPREVTGSSSELRCLFDTTLTEYDADREGFSVSCGGYARPYRDNNGHFLGDEDAEAAVPVVLRVYGSVSSGTGRVLLKTAADSWVEVELTSTEGWREGWGWLAVGINPSDVKVAQVFVGGASTTFSIEALTLEVYPG